MDTSFQDWLRSQLKERGWTQAELSRRSGISPTHITKFLNEERGLSEKTIADIARALTLPPEEVFRAAGLLPPIAEKSAQMNELEHLADKLDEDDLQDLIEYAKMRLKRREAKQDEKTTSRRGTPARIASKGS